MATTVGDGIDAILGSTKSVGSVLGSCDIMSSDRKFNGGKSPLTKTFLDKFNLAKPVGDSVAGKSLFEGMIPILKDIKAVKSGAGGNCFHNVLTKDIGVGFNAHSRS